MKAVLDAILAGASGAELPAVALPEAYRAAVVRKEHRNRHEGKVAVRCLAPPDGLGTGDPELRARVGEERIGRFRDQGGTP